MAKAQKRRVQRPKDAPRAGDGAGNGKQQPPKRELKQPRAPREPRPIEETLFFSRLRRQAKWVFVLLALAFALTFVVFGVGSGGSGLGDVIFLNDNAGGDTPSVSEARERIEKNPDDAEAYYELSQAHQAEGDTDEAIEALEQYTALRPRDRLKQEELASLYLAQGQAAEQRAQIAQAEAALVTGGGIFTPQLRGADDQTVDLGPGQGVEDAVSAEAGQEYSKFLTETTTAYANAQAAYETVAQLAPKDPTVYQNLALAAQNANDLPAAIEAYEKFLELAPEDPSADLVREQVKQLKEFQKAQPSVQAG